MPAYDPSRDIIVSRAGAKLKLAIYDLAEAAGLTRQELTCILAEEVYRRVEQDTNPEPKKKK